MAAAHVLVETIREKILFSKNALFVEVITTQQRFFFKDKKLDSEQNECSSCKCFRCGYIDNLIDKYPKPPKDNIKQLNIVCFNERGNCALQNNPRTVMVVTIKRYMHLWHVCLVMEKVLVEILVIVRN